ncbi:hypothetical protein EDD85DRAFT_797313 [Armillaria nabsnona]|nr:hypothetical protein EDD85DRAFT_797313 [Armillaria nabsnona]
MDRTHTTSNSNNQLQQIPNPQGRILSSDSRTALADVAGRLADLFQEHTGALNLVVIDVRALWRTLLPWALLVLLRYVVLLERIEGVPHHHLLSSNNSNLVFPLLCLLAQLATFCDTREAMAQSSAFITVLTKAWMILIPHKGFRLQVTLAASAVGSLNESRHLATIASFTPHLSLPMLESITHEFLLGPDVDYVHLERVMWSMDRVICVSPKGSIFCSSLAIRWIFRFAWHLSNLELKNITLECLKAALSLLEACILHILRRDIDPITLTWLTTPAAIFVANLAPSTVADVNQFSTVQRTVKDMTGLTFTRWFVKTGKGRSSHADSEQVAEGNVIISLSFIGGLRVSYRTLNTGEANWREHGLYMLEVRMSGGRYGSVRAKNLYEGDGLTEPLELVW